MPIGSLSPKVRSSVTVSCPIIGIVDTNAMMKVLNVLLILSEEFVMIILVDEMFCKILSAKVMWCLLEYGYESVRNGSK